MGRKEIVSGVIATMIFLSGCESHAVNSGRAYGAALYREYSSPSHPEISPRDWVVVKVECDSQSRDWSLADSFDPSIFRQACLDAVEWNQRRETNQ